MLLIKVGESNSYCDYQSVKCSKDDYERWPSCEYKGTGAVHKFLIQTTFCYQRIFVKSIEKASVSVFPLKMAEGGADKDTRIRGKRIILIDLMIKHQDGEEWLSDRY